MATAVFLTTLTAPDTAPTSTMLGCDAAHYHLHHPAQRPRTCCMMAWNWDFFRSVSLDRLDRMSGSRL